MIWYNVFFYCAAAWQSITMNRKSANKIKCNANFSDFLLVAFFGFIASSHSIAFPSLFGFLRFDILRDIKSYLNRYFDSTSHTSSPWSHMLMIFLCLFTSFFSLYLSHSVHCFATLLLIRLPFFLQPYTYNHFTSLFPFTHLQHVFASTLHITFSIHACSWLAIICVSQPCRLIRSYAVAFERIHPCPR